MTHQYTNEITCPYCGHEFSDSWDYSDNEVECPECDKAFTFERHTEVTYTSHKADCEEHDFGPPEYTIRTQAEADRMNAENYLDYRKWGAISAWRRDCKSCEHYDYQQVPEGAPCPWSTL